MRNIRRTNKSLANSQIRHLKAQTNSAIQHFISLTVKTLILFSLALLLPDKLGGLPDKLPEALMLLINVFMMMTMINLVCTYIKINELRSKASKAK